MPEDKDNRRLDEKPLRGDEEAGSTVFGSPVALDNEGPTSCTGKVWSVLCLLDYKFLMCHLMVNVLTVDIWNIGLEHTFCKNELLACCDPFNTIHFYVAGFPCNTWLIGHWVAYCFAGATYGKTDLTAHLNLVLCQLVWFWFEFFTYYHTYEWEQLTYYSQKPVPLASCRTLEICERTSPCQSEPYYSTWIPIWQDYVYNTLGQFAGMAIFIFLAKRGYSLTESGRLVQLQDQDRDVLKGGMGPGAIVAIVTVIVVLVMVLYHM